MRMVRVAMMSKVNDATANAFGVIPMLCDNSSEDAQNTKQSAIYLLPRGSILLFVHFHSPCTRLPIRG